MSEANGPPASGTSVQNDSSGVQDQAQQVAGQAQGKAQEVAGNAQGSLREQLSRRSNDAGEKIAGTADDLRSVGEELRNQGKETPAKFADMAAERTEKVGSYLRDSDVDKLVGDVEDFGRRQPLAALAGGVAVGLVAARFLKASSRSRYRQRTGSGAATPGQRAAGPPYRDRSEATPAGTIPAQVPASRDPVLGSAP
jgi:hypothetical protein